MSTHLTKIWWDLNKHKLVEQAIPEAEIYKREWAGLTEEEKSSLVEWARPDIIDAIELKLRERNT